LWRKIKQYKIEIWELKSTTNFFKL
jgi:hypothetical protein